MTSAPTTTDVSSLLAEHAAYFPSAALEGSTVDHLLANWLDVVAVTIGGVNTAGLPELRRFLEASSAQGDAVVVATRLRLAPDSAAFANAAAAHALEWDDALDAGGGMHAGPAVHFSALAIADSLGGVSGTEYLGAVAVGLDVAVRLAMATTADFGWHRASAFSVFGATVAATRLLGLDAERTRHALGLAFSQASGSRQAIRDGSLSTRLHPGLAARNAVTAAQLAAAGITASKDIFEGPDGFFPLYQRNRYERDRVLDGLGSSILSSRIATKPFPGGRTTHGFIEAVLANKGSGPWQGTEEVVIHVPKGSVGLFGDEFPTDFVATYGLKYSVALAIATGEARVTHFVDPGSAPSTVRWIFDRTSVSEDAPEGSLGSIDVRSDGQTRVLEVTEASGSPEHPLSRRALREKLWELCAFADDPLPREAVERAVALVENGRGLVSTNELTSLLAVP
jgi:2-methylcitrate dehydratase PrpD